jgi:NADP-dependent 3-hydroxy acid dehydrogenase YdfG
VSELAAAGAPGTCLNGRVAVVTGASRGLGRAIALRLAREGADCAITYRRNEHLAREVAGEVEGAGRRALALPLELGEPDEVGPVFERIASAWGRVDTWWRTRPPHRFGPCSSSERTTWRARSRSPFTR